MTFWQGSKAELITAMAAAIGLPFYLGIIHASVPQLALYSGVAGAAMATGELVENPRFQQQGAGLFAADAAVWVTVVAFFGGLAYLVALIF